MFDTRVHQSRPLGFGAFPPKIRTFSIINNRVQSTLTFKVSLVHTLADPRKSHRPSFVPEISKDDFLQHVAIETIPHFSQNSP